MEWQRGKVCVWVHCTHVCLSVWMYKTDDELLEPMTRYFCGCLDVWKKNVATINQIDVEKEWEWEWKGEREGGESSLLLCIITEQSQIKTYYLPFTPLSVFISFSSFVCLFFCLGRLLLLLSFVDRFIRIRSLFVYAHFILFAMLFKRYNILKVGFFKNQAVLSIIEAIRFMCVAETFYLFFIELIFSFILTLRVDKLSSRNVLISDLFIDSHIIFMFSSYEKETENFLHHVRFKSRFLFFVEFYSYLKRLIQLISFCSLLKSILILFSLQQRSLISLSDFTLIRRLLKQIKKNDQQFFTFQFCEKK